MTSFLGFMSAAEGNGFRPRDSRFYDDPRTEIALGRIKLIPLSSGFDANPAFEGDVEDSSKSCISLFITPRPLFQVRVLR